MARVFIDAHMFSEAWFSKVLDELVKANGVVFAYCPGAKIHGEAAKVRKALEFYKLIGEKRLPGGGRKREDVKVTDIVKEEDSLNSSPAFSACAACDDPHIFALIAIKPTPYVFSNDMRMVQCRRKISGSLSKKYCKFCVIGREETYGKLKGKILAS